MHRRVTSPGVPGGSSCPGRVVRHAALGGRHQLRQAVVRTARGAAPTRTRPQLGCRAGAAVPVAFYVGDSWLPRHVVLGDRHGADDSLRLYDPALGGVRVVTREAFATTTLPFGRWSHPWFVVAPGA